MSQIEDVQSWIGADVIDADDQRIGKLDELLLDPTTGEPVFGIAKTTVLGRHHIVPLEGAAFSRGHVRVTCTKDVATSAPSADRNAVTASEASILRRHFGMAEGRSAEPDAIVLESASSITERREAYEADQRRADELERQASQKDAEASKHLDASQREVGTANAAAADRDGLLDEARRLREQRG